MQRRKYTEVDTLFGRRTVVFVKYPFEWTGHTVVAHLYWAKRSDVVNLYDGFVVKCYVKPKYLKHFKRENAPYIQWHKHFSATCFEVGEHIYDE